MGYLYIRSLLIFVGCLVLHAQSQTICGKDQYTVVTSDGSFVRCLNCLTCHAGRGLHPPCGSRIRDPPNPDCIACPAGTFSDELDSSPCHSCQRCAEHEIVTAPCTNQSNRICNGTCETGYFYSKKDSTHSCQKCAYCCFDGYDEEMLECASQGLKASKQHCRPRPDKDCGPGSSSPTDHPGGTEASENGGLSNATITVIVVGVVSVVIVSLAIVICLYRTKKKQEAQTVTDMNHQFSAENYAQHGPVIEPTVQYNPKDTLSTAEMPAGSHKGLGSVTVERQDGANSDAYLNQNTASQQTKQNASHSSLPSGESSGSAVAAVNLNAAKDNTDDRMSGGNPAVLSVSTTDAAAPAGEVPGINEDVPSDLKDTTSAGLMRKLSRQLSKDSQRSGNGADPEAGRWKRSPSTSSFTEMLKRRRSSSKRDEPLVDNEEQDTDGPQGPITILKDLSSQEVKEDSKVELVFKCKALGNNKLTYQWFKDEIKLPGKNEDTIVLKSVKLRDFGWYKCVASCGDDSEHSSLAELDVTPRDGTTYRCLVDIDFNTQGRIESLLAQERSGLGWWRQVAFKYGMDQLTIESLENDQKAGRKTLGYLQSSNPDLTVYNFCKTLKDHSIRRLDIVKELLEHLSVPSSSNVYV